MTSPEVIGIMPIAALSIVLFPEPLGPITVSNSDLLKEIETSFKICFLP